MAVVQVLVDSKPGPLPLTGQFQPQGDLVPSIYFTGTAQTSVPGVTIQVQVNIYDADGKDAGGTSGAVFSNEAKQHKTMLALLINQKPWNFGQTYSYQILAVGPTTTSDANDIYSLTILY